MTSQELKATLWAAADKLRAQMDAAEYKHLVLGLIFLKYVSDAFDERRAAVALEVADPANDLYLPDPADREGVLEDRDYYKSANVFWVPQSARWETLRNQAKQPDIGRILDDALVGVEDNNTRLKGVLDKRFARTQIEPSRLGQLIDLISKIGFNSEEDKAKDVLGEVYEYFLGQFATAEGKKGGQFYTPASVVRVLVDVLAPHTGATGAASSSSSTPASWAVWQRGCIASSRLRTSPRSPERRTAGGRTADLWWITSASPTN